MGVTLVHRLGDHIQNLACCLFDQNYGLVDDGAFGVGARGRQLFYQIVGQIFLCQTWWQFFFLGKSGR